MKSTECRVINAMIDLVDTMVDLPATMVDLIAAIVDPVDTRVDLATTTVDLLVAMVSLATEMVVDKTLAAHKVFVVQKFLVSNRFLMEFDRFLVDIDRFPIVAMVLAAKDYQLLKDKFQKKIEIYQVTQMGD